MIEQPQPQEAAPAAAVAVAAPSPAEEHLLGGLDIGKVMASAGPVVKCVLLRARPDAAVDTGVNKGGNCAEAAAPRDDDPETPSGEAPPPGPVEEIAVDTTPRKSEVSKILGGEFTFLGQYEEEGIMVMVRRPDWEGGDDAAGGGKENAPPLNAHSLQPPLHDAKVRGDILLMRVAPTEEELDAEADDEKDAPTNDEFFLDYTKEEYLKFAARTDIVAKEIEPSSEEESEEEEVDHSNPSSTAASGGETDEDEEDDEDFDPEDDSDNEDSDSEDNQVGMMNMIMGHLLRKFREDNGRGPDSLELLEIRKALADRLGVDVPPVDEARDDWEEKSPDASKKRKRETMDGSEGRKKVVVAEEKNETTEIPCRQG